MIFNRCFVPQKFIQIGFFPSISIHGGSGGVLKMPVVPSPCAWTKLVNVTTKVGIQDHYLSVLDERISYQELCFQNR